MLRKKLFFPALLLLLSACSAPLGTATRSAGTASASTRPSPSETAALSPTIAPTGTSPSVPVRVVYPSPVSVAKDHSCALTGSGGVKCWGNNMSGQLGIGTTRNAFVPQVIPGLQTGVRAVSAGGDHSCALLDSGVVKCWGDNWYGQTGSGTMNSGRYSPADVVGLIDGTAVAAGEYHACAATAGGGVKCWGRNTEGQLGDGTTTTSKRPVAVKGLSGEIITVTAGGDNTCALKSDGTVVCWGANGAGQLGDGTFIGKSTPVPVEGLSGVVAVSAGFTHTCAVTNDGRVMCWGDGFRGGMGNGEDCCVNVPFDIPGLPEAMVAVSAGFEYSCGITRSGGVACWGANEQGQLGDGTNENRKIPVVASAVADPAVSISAGKDRVCAVTTAGRVLCWGNIPTGKAGDDSAAGGNPMVEVIDLTGAD